MTEKEVTFISKREELFNIYNNRIFDSNNENRSAISKDFYAALKKLCYTYYKGERLPYSYLSFIQKVMNYEHLFIPVTYNLNFPKYDFKKTLDKPVSTKNPEAILDYIVNQTRNFLYKRISFGNRDALSYEEYDLCGECGPATDYVCALAAMFNLAFKKVVIYPCFNPCSGSLNSGDHCYAYVSISSKKYLIDCTYSQFFVTNKCLLERLGVPYLRMPVAGAFTPYDPNRLSLGYDLLTRGWVECTDENERLYLEGFMLSFRNGLYYERTSDYSFTTTYTIKDYLNFIHYDDCLYKHEEDAELDFQTTSLNAPDLLIRAKI